MPGHYSKSGASKGAKSIDINSGDTESGSINKEDVLPGTGSKYNPDGTKRTLGLNTGG
tara:strand:+ start:652 stop:825 length:174 start_codon:yes stop_codon:yes gene_type:complete